MIIIYSADLIYHGIGIQGEAKSHFQARRELCEGVFVEGERGDSPEAIRTGGWRFLCTSSTEGLLCHPNPGVSMLYLLVLESGINSYCSINEIAPKPRKILQLLRLLQINNGVFVKVTKATQQMLRLVVSTPSGEKHSLGPFVIMSGRLPARSIYEATK